jgi:hypothetical protein
MQFQVRGLGPLAAGLLGLLLVPAASAGELDRARVARPASAAQGLTLGKDLEVPANPALDVVPTGDLSPIDDFHPETDRWTARTNRIRITPFIGVWFFSNELDIRHDVCMGVRLNWEVPGFIGIRLDVGTVPLYSRLEIKNGTSSGYLQGTVANFNLSLGIFNPELSIEGLAFWAGFGLGLWYYDYNEDDIFGSSTGVDGEWNDTNIGGNIFVELDYKLTDIFHIGIGLREHIILADHTNDGRFYEFNDVEQSFGGDDRNDGILDDLAVVTELTLNFSILF